MKILVLAYEVPATTNMPGSPRLFSLAKHLSLNHQLTLVTFEGEPGRYDAFVADPESAGVFDEVVLLPPAPPGSHWGRQLHRLRQEAYWGTRLRAPAYHAEIQRRIRDLLSEGRFDVLFVDGLGASQYVVDNNFPCPAAIDLHDCMSLLYSRSMRLERHWVRKLKHYTQIRSTRRWERALGRNFGAVICNSPVDTSAFCKIDPTARAVTIGNGVDIEFFAPADASDVDPSSIVFTGVMDYAPNEDAALHFVEHILPMIRARRPAASFRVVGKGPTERVLALGKQPGVTVVGQVPDVRPSLDAAGIFVCPLRWGAGVKNKILVALAMAKPVVASRLSAEGLELRDGVDWLVADDVADFADKVVRLIEDPAYAKQLAQSGRRAVTEKYSWSASARILEEMLLELVDGALGTAPRSKP